MNSKITFVGKNSKGLRELILFKKFLKVIMKVIIMFFINYYLKELDLIKVK
jgi:hypothetical protein